jgi:hypothetical protein
MVGSCQHGDKPSDSASSGYMFCQLRNYQIIKFTPISFLKDEMQVQKKMIPTA